MDLRQIHARLQPFSPFVLSTFAKQYGINLSAGTIEQMKSLLQQCVNENASYEEFLQRMESVIGRKKLEKLLQLLKYA